MTKFFSLSVLLTAAFAVVPAAAQTSGQASGEPGGFALPDGSAKQLVQERCIGCHDLRRVVNSNYSPQEWQNVVNMMKSAGAPINQAEADQIRDYLNANFPGKPLLRRLVLLPLILPGIITGLSLLLFAVRISLDLSLITIFLGHGTALISVATTELFAGLQKMDRRQEEASLDLGATPWRTFWLVTLPNLKLSLIAAALLIFTLSMDEIAVTFFLYGREYTLPLEIWGRLRRGITPEINAISTLILVVSIILITVWYHLRTRSEHQ